MIKTIINCSTGEVENINMNENEMPSQEEIKNYQRQQILSQLAELDKVIPRVLEDIILQGNFNLHQSKLDIITQKETLRRQLQALGV